jgi:hypothetical protein
MDANLLSRLPVRKRKRRTRRKIKELLFEGEASTSFRRYNKGLSASK